MMPASTWVSQLTLYDVCIHKGTPPPLYDAGIIMGTHYDAYVIEGSPY